MTSIWTKKSHGTPDVSTPLTDINSIAPYFSKTIHTTYLTTMSNSFAPSATIGTTTVAVTTPSLQTLQVSQRQIPTDNNV